MKVSVASKKKKVLQIIVTILVWILTGLLFASNAKIMFENGTIMATIFLFALDAAQAVITCITLFSNVVIDEKGITLRRGIIRVNYISWEHVRRVEDFEALYRKSLILGDRYFRVLTKEEVSYAFKYRTPPINCEEESICFVYDSKAYDLIKQYYKGDIYR